MTESEEALRCLISVLEEQIAYESKDGETKVGIDYIETCIRYVVAEFPGAFSG